MVGVGRRVGLIHTGGCGLRTNPECGSVKCRLVGCAAGRVPREGRPAAQTCLLGLLLSPQFLAFHFESKNETSMSSPRQTPPGAAASFAGKKRLTPLGGNSRAFGRRQPVRLLVSTVFLVFVA